MTNLQKGQRFPFCQPAFDQKHVLMALLLLISACFHGSTYANAIGDVKQWNCGSLTYTPAVQADGSIIFTGCTEGQDLAFRLTPTLIKDGEYSIADENTDECENPFWYAQKVKHMRKDGQNLLCFYDEQGRLRDMLSPLEYPTSEEQAEHKWARQLKGEYTSSYGEPLTIGDDGTMRFSRIDLTYGHITFNGMIVGLVEIKGGTRLEGIWKVELTPEGLKFTKGIMDDYWQFQPTEGEEIFTWARTDIPRFDYGSKILLNDDASWNLDPAVQRVLRNEIWMHHGYVPASPDLKEYLVGKEWFTPRPSNDGILEELSLIEVLNIERLKTAETLKAQYK